MSKSEINFIQLMKEYRTEPRCFCTPFAFGNRGCPLHDAAINGKFDMSDMNYDDMRRRLGGPPIRIIQTTAPEELAQHLQHWRSR